jgi:hypothetical protein
MNQKVCSPILSRVTSQAKSENHSHPQSKKLDASRICKESKQLTLWESPQKPAAETKLFSEKPQIVSIPGVPPKEQHRYRVTLGNQILGDRLTLDQALALAKRWDL